MSDADRGEQPQERLAVGVRIFEVDGEMYLARADMIACVDNSKGQRWCFLSRAARIDPLSDAEDENDTMGQVDIDRRPRARRGCSGARAVRGDPVAGLSETELRDLLREAREQEGMDEEEE